MNTPTANGAPATERRTRSGQCADAKCDSGSRNRFFVGKRMTPGAFRVEQDYLIGRRRLINRAIHGWGVVYGFPIAIPPKDAACCAVPPGKARIGAGLALDRAGRELVQTEPLLLELDKLVVLDAEGAPLADGIVSLQPKPGECWLLSVHYAERRVGPVMLRDSCSCERREWGGVFETVCYSIRRVKCTDYCADRPCELTCDCGAGPCCDAHADRPGAPPRGGQCLCEHLTALSPDPECECLRELNEVTRADLCNGVPLACVALEEDPGCGGWRLLSVYDACGPRRLVKRNDVLYDLLRGCDLTTISEIGWADWFKKQPVPFRTFSDAFGAEVNDKGDYVTQKFWVTFSRPVLTRSLTPACFSMSVVGPAGNGWWHVRRVPIENLVLEPAPGPDSGETYAQKATLVVACNWITNVLRGPQDKLFRGVTHIEVQVRGSLIIDCNQQAVDGSARGNAPAGSGVPGGTFLSTFAVDGRSGCSSKPTSGESSPSPEGATS
ncbi:hypothetical protein BTHE68_72050 (plasmid) [Burkholderia sp. THE68]|uniref:hypothetical protein n=1 Tax=Burkholderia sp. THE68 TaxID=758782 RepID=UPI0013196F46|nr:hypothetical protein [Burkholderia sp. THE68]BBU33471.1 hypothetical protein BTHE68_72050 [Burkholderia sp. THE68]